MSSARSKAAATMSRCCRIHARIEISGHPVYVLGLATLIELKRGSTRLKDQLVLPVLEETLKQSGG